MTILKLGAGSVSGALLGLWQGLPVMVAALLILMALDVISGMLAAFVARQLGSRTAREGIVRKAMTLIVVAAAAVVERYLDVPVPVVGTVTGGVAGMFCVAELVSIVENAGRAGVWIPGPLRDALAQLQRAADVKRETD